MATGLALRQYQHEAIQAVNTAWAGGVKRPAVVLPCGAGKTVIFSHLADEFIRRTGKRALILVNRDELAEQALDKIRSVSPSLNAGKVKASHDDTEADVIVASVQTVSRQPRMDRLLASHERRPIGLVITDEAHFAVAPTYVRTLDSFPDAVHAGFTATLARGDGVGLGSVWDDVVYSKSILWMIKQGYLVDVRGQQITAEGLNLGSVRRSNGDYSAGDLGRALEESGANSVVARAYAQYASDRQGIVFTPTVANAHDVAEHLALAGFRTAVVSGETPIDERRRIYEDSRTGRVQILVNCQVLTTGFDAPWISCAFIARPTRSETLWIQMAGRAIRTWPGKKDALILNLGDAGGRFATLVDLEPGIAEIRDGESLLEAKERDDNLPEKDRRELEVKAQAFDLFAGSSQSWLLTNKGLMFLPLGGDGEIFLYPYNGVFHVIHAPKQGQPVRLHKSLPLGSATAWAEAEAEELMVLNTGRSASWRRKPATQSQKDTLLKCGIPFQEGIRAGEAGNLLSVKFASQRLDRYA